MSPLQRRMALVGLGVAGLCSGALLRVAVGGSGGLTAVPSAGGQPGELVVSYQRAEISDTSAPVVVTSTTAAPMTTAPTPTVPTPTLATTTSTPAEVPHPPYPAWFEPAPNEVQIDAKRTGAAVAYQLTNYGPEASIDEMASAVTPDLAGASALIAEAGVVHHAGMWSRGTIEYAQLGGHKNNRISIMVVVRQEIGAQDAVVPHRVETRTMDVRLVKNAFGEWEFDLLASAGGEPVVRPAGLSPLAAAVVDHERIWLPDSAKWDIYTGHTDPALLRFMLDLAEAVSFKAVVLHTGHPHHVFGTDRLSNHTVGRAVDIYEVDSVRVIDSHRLNSALYSVSEELVSRADIREFGSPWLFDGAVAPNFTNEVHHDHLHIGVNPETAPQG